MKIDKQRLLVEYLVSSPATFAICSGILKPDYFDAEIRSSVKFIMDYYNKFNNTPDIDQIKAETGAVLKDRDIGDDRDKIKYCSTEIEKYCKERAVEKAILTSVDLIPDGDFGKIEQLIKDAVTISLQRDIGIDYFATVEERLDRMLKNPPVHPTGWTEIDEALYGGISRRELLLVAANSGVGKSVTLSNLGINFAEAGKHVLYISLELSQDIVAQRMDTMFTGIGRVDWMNHVQEIVTKISAKGKECGSFFLKFMPAGSTANDIRGYLKEYELVNDRVPDLLIVDYLDEMGSNANISSENIFEKDKACASELRQVGVDYDMYVATASQLNRSAVGATHHDHSQIAGGISKINITDVYWKIVQTDVQKINGEITFIFQKTRNSDGNGRHVELKWNPKTLRITDRDGIGEKEKLEFVPKKSGISETPTGNKLMDLLNSN